MNQQMTRRHFTFGVASALTLGATGLGAAESAKKDGLIWAMYQQLGSHMWHSAVKFPMAANGHYCGEKTMIDDASWERRMAATAKTGCNMMCIDLAEGLRYPSHPELALEGSRTPEWMNARVRKLRDLGITAIPSLNFSTAHDYWLGAYSRMLSTPTYYRVCRDLIRETAEIFENPPYFLMGMDEENEDCVKGDYLSIRRQKDLLWHDIGFFAKEMSACGARPWMWSDYEWWGSEAFCRNVSREILQTNWFYGWDFDYQNRKDISRTYVESYVRLEKAGYDQVPGCSNYLSGQHEKAKMKKNVENIPGTVEFCKKVIDPKRLKGFYCMPWVSTLADSDPTWIDAAEQLAAARARHYSA